MEAVQVLRFERVSSKSKAIIEMHKLEDIFSSMSSTKLAILSSCGNSKLGKSFVLNFIKSVFSIESTSGIKNEIFDWENPDLPLQGFPWGKTAEHRTNGVWITSKPVATLKNVNDEPVALFLMDTTGIFEEDVNIDESITILTFSLLLSATTFFSLNAELELSKIQKIAQVIEDVSETYFPDIQPSRLYFLIRDWIHQNQFPFGEVGGSNYLDNLLESVTDISDKDKNARSVLKKKSPHCFLLPPLGKKSEEIDFTGSLNELTPTFARVLESFLRSSNLVHVDAATKTGAQILYIVESLNHVPVGAFGTVIPKVALEIGKNVELEKGENVCPTDLALDLLEKYKEEFQAAVLEDHNVPSSEDLHKIHIKVYASILSLYNPTTQYSFAAYMDGSKRLQEYIEAEFLKIRAHFLGTDAVNEPKPNEFVEESKNVGNFELTSTENASDVSNAELASDAAKGEPPSDASDVGIPNEEEGLKIEVLDKQSVLKMATQKYLKSLEQLPLGLPSQVEVKVQRLSGISKQDSIYYIRENLTTQNEADDAVEIFEQEAEAAYNKAWAAHQRRMDSKVRAVKVFIKSLTQDYENRMSFELDENQELDEKHAEVTDEILSNFMLQCQVRDKKFCEVYADSLQKSLSNIYKKNILKQKKFEVEDGMNEN